jgi:hypothetical protein
MMNKSDFEASERVLDMLRESVDKSGLYLTQSEISALLLRFASLKATLRGSERELHRATFHEDMGR